MTKQTKKERELILDIAFGTLSNFIRAFQRIRYTGEKDSNPANGLDKEKEWGFIPRGPKDLILTFINLVTKYMPPTTPKNDTMRTFLDVGCGVGNVMLTARAAGYNVFGIEKDTKTFALAQKIFDNHVTNDDMLLFEDYGKYDIIYYWVPIKDPRLMTQAATRIAKQMTIGSIVWPIGHIHPFRHNPAFELLNNGTDPYLFKKIAEFHEKKPIEPKFMDLHEQYR